MSVPSVSASSSAPSDRALALALLAASAVLHFAGLSYPAQVVFDEVHFGKFVTAYCCSGERFFDIHPPHAKLLAALVAKALGYEGGFSFERIGMPYGGVPVFALRAFPALCGTLIAPLVFLTARRLGATAAAALLVGLAATLDDALLVQMRILSIDGLLLVSLLASLYAALRACDAAGRASWGWTALCGVAAGLALGTKFLGLQVVAVVGAAFLADVLTRRGATLGLRAGQFVAMGAVAAAVYVAGWWWHFHLLTEPGFGDAFIRPTGRFFHDVVALHREMFQANYRLSGGHPDASAWWTWPLMKTPVFYWSGQDAVIYFLGNPVVWWGSTLVLLLAPWAGLRGGPAPWRWWVPLACWAAAFAPYALISRVMFMYHYLAPLLFALLASALVLDRLGWTRPGALRSQRKGWFAAIALLVVGFAAILPLTQGWPVYDEYVQHVFRLFPGWRDR